MVKNVATKNANYYNSWSVYMVQNIFTKALKIENSLLKSLHSSVNEIKDHGSVIKFYSAGKTNMQIIS